MPRSLAGANPAPVPAGNSLYRATASGTSHPGDLSARRALQDECLVSPVLANIYLHYVLDLWFEKRYAKSCRGKAHLVRFADDFVARFQWEDDAKRFLSELKDRLAAWWAARPNANGCVRN